MRRRHQRSRGGLLCLAVLLLTGCSTTSTLQTAHWQFVSGDAAAAVSTLDNSDEVSKKDQLLYWLEKGMYLYYAGDYQRSAQELLKAASYLEDTDYVSVSDEARELLANEWAGRYRGEYSEQLWIHSVLMMNFLNVGQFESAAVEARRALEVIEARTDVLQHDTFTRALIALSFEAAGLTNDAYIVNSKLAADNQFAALDPLLFQQALKLGFTNEASQLKQQISNQRTQQYDTQNTLVIFVPSGHAPEKFSGTLLTSEYSRLAFPEYYLRPSRPAPVSVLVNNQPCNCTVLHSDLGELVSHSLQKRGARLATKALVRAVAKEAVIEAAEEADEIVGDIARVLLFALEEADTRSWRSLPRHFTMIRVPLPSTQTTPLIELRRAVPGGEERIPVVLDGASRGLQFYSMLPAGMQPVNDLSPPVDTRPVAPE